MGIIIDGAYGMGLSARVLDPWPRKYRSVWCGPGCMFGKKDVGSVNRSVRYGEHWCRRARNTEIVEPQSQWSVVNGVDGKMRAISVGVTFVYGQWLPIGFGGVFARVVFREGHSA